MKRYIVWAGAGVMLALLLVGMWVTAPVKVAGKRMAGDAARDVRTFITPHTVQKYANIQDVMLAWASGYHYTPDAWYVDDGHDQRITLGADTMLTGTEIQRIMNRAKVRYFDCDKGAVWGTSALRAAGYDAWFCAGSVEQWDDTGNYLGKSGHAWVLVKIDSLWYLWETTIYDDTIQPTLIPWPVISDEVKYNLDWRTSEWLTIRRPFNTDYGGQIPPAVTPDRILLLRQALEKLGG